ncbi:hypothetical protein HY546_01975 [archaeon]|nr:hypothetical protein [archaeon]
MLQQLSEGVKKNASERKITKKRAELIQKQLKTELEKMMRLPWVLRARRGLEAEEIPKKVAKSQVVFGYSVGLGKRLSEDFNEQDVKNVLKYYGLKNDTHQNRIEAAKRFTARLLLNNHLVTERLKGKFGGPYYGYATNLRNVTPTDTVDLDTIEFQKRHTKQERQDQEDTLLMAANGFYQTMGLHTDEWATIFDGVKSKAYKNDAKRRQT